MNRHVCYTEGLLYFTSVLSLPDDYWPSFYGSFLGNVGSSTESFRPIIQYKIVCAYLDESLSGRRPLRRGYFGRSRPGRLLLI